MKAVIFRLAMAALIVAPFVKAQPAAAPAFAAASVKATHSTDPRRIDFEYLPGGRLRVENVPLLLIIAEAYNLPFQSSRLKRGDSPLVGERFDIDATAGPGAIPAGATKEQSDDLMRAMLRRLLAERFHLEMRSETKEQPVYAIVVAKDGPKLKPAGIEEKDCGAPAAKGIACHQFNGGRGRGLHAKACNMEDLARFVSNWTDRPILDKTGLKGLYQFETRGWADITPGPAPAAGAVAEDGQEAASLPTVFTLFSDMGLKLDSQRAPVETFTIEGVERPTEN